MNASADSVAKTCGALAMDHGLLDRLVRGGLGHLDPGEALDDVLRRFGGDCYNYCLLAMGQIDLVVEARLKPFDIMPLVPIVERAGGVVTTWEGGDPSKGGRIVAAGDPALHAAALKILSA